MCAPKSPKFNLVIATAAAAYVSSSQVPAAHSKLSEISLAANALASESSFHLSYKTLASVYMPWIFSLVLNLVAAVIANAALVNAAPASAASATAVLARLAFASTTPLAIFATTASAITATTIAIASVVTTVFAKANLVKTATAIAIAAAASHTSSPQTHAASAFVNRRRIAKSVRSHRSQTK